MSVQVGDLHRKRIVRRMSGEIIDLVDETDGGVIISKGRVINQKKVDEIAQKEKDRQLASQAESKQVVNPDVPDRSAPPSKVIELEKRVESIDKKLDSILQALSKK